MTISDWKFPAVSGGRMVRVQLRCSECNEPIGDLTEDDAGCTSGDVECERCHSHLAFADSEGLFDAG